jgi:predicted transcriptional regulator
MAGQKKRKASKDRTVRASVSFSANQYRELERIASDQRVSLAWVVREAIEQYIKGRWPLLAPEKKTD